MIKVKLPCSEAYESHMEIHTSTVNKDISLEREFEKNLSEPTRKHGVMDQGKDRKRDSKRKWDESVYYVQDRKDVPHTAVKMPCAITQFPELPFLGQMQNLVE